MNGTIPTHGDLVVRRDKLAIWHTFALPPKPRTNDHNRIPRTPNMNTPNLTRRLLGLLSLTLIMAGCAASGPATIQTGADAEVTFDGLHRVDNSMADEAWARPDFDITGYTKIMPVRTAVEYTMTKNRGRSPQERSRKGPYFIDDETRATFEALVSEVFISELQKSTRFELVSEPGPDVLMVSGSLLDVSSFVPEDPPGGMTSNTFIRKVGEVTLVLELRDSESGTTLARSVDRRAAENTGASMQYSNTVSNTNEVRRLLTFWASRLRAGLDQFAGASTE